MKITNQPSVTPVIAEGRNYRLTNIVTYVFGVDDKEKIIIRPGFVFDGASVPKFLHWFIGPMDPRVVAPALIHDAIYEVPNLEGIGVYIKDGILTKKRFTKEEADNLFREANIASNMDRVRTTLAYWAVRLFGRGNFASQAFEKAG